MAAAAAVSGCAAVLFYNSAWGLLWYPVFAVFAVRIWEAQRTERRRRRFLEDFRELLLLISGSLQAGAALENACRSAETELSRMAAGGSPLLEGIRRVNRRVHMHVPMEEAFWELAAAESYEELQSFAQMLSFSRRLGGNYAAAIQRAADRIGERIDVEQEISVLLAEKRLELVLMSVMPAGVMAYVRLTSPEYFSAVYGNLQGALFMSICLAVYLSAVALGLRLIRIPV